MTVIAAGFDAGTPSPMRRSEPTRRAVPEPAGRALPHPRARPGVPAAAGGDAAPAPAPQQQQPARPQPRPVAFEDDLDVPDFLK